MTAFEFRPVASAAVDTAASQILWEPPDRSQIVLASEVGPWLPELGRVPAPAVDLARIAVAAFAADQLESRSQTFSRTIDLTIHLSDPDRFTDQTLQRIVDLLHSISGDAWSLATAADASTRPDRETPRQEAVDQVALLSGGLDSFAGALISSDQADVTTAYLGHWNQSPVKRAQNAVDHYFSASGRPIEYRQLRIGVASGKADHTTRTRSLLFMALGVAWAAARGASRLLVPENGFTSVNPPLGQERGGALTTRSTHPRTFASLNAILTSIGIDVLVENPHRWQTKGELLAAGISAAPADVAEIAAATYSCAKPPQGYAGANPNDHCGNCVACIIRRGAFIAAGLADGTEYASVYLTGAGREKFAIERSRDEDAVKRAVLTPVDELDLLAIGPFPDDFDVEAGVGLCNRGLAEMSLVRL